MKIDEETANKLMAMMFGSRHTENNADGTFTHSAMPSLKENNILNEDIISDILSDEFLEERAKMPRI